MPSEISTTRNVIFTVRGLFICEFFFSAMSGILMLLFPVGTNALTGTLLLGTSEPTMQFQKKLGIAANFLINRNLGQAPANYFDQMNGYTVRQAASLK